MPDLGIELKIFTDLKMISSNFSSLIQAYMHQIAYIFFYNSMEFLLNNSNRNYLILKN